MQARALLNQDTYSSEDDQDKRLFDCSSFKRTFKAGDIRGLGSVREPGLRELNYERGLGEGTALCGRNLDYGGLNANVSGHDLKSSRDKPRPALPDHF